MTEERGENRKSPRKVFCLVLALCMVIAPVVAQDNSGGSESMTEEYNQGWLDGQADAKGNGVWILSGLLLGPIGIILPWVINPKVPGARLIGKSVSYVEGYTAGYRQKAKPKNFYYSLIGFGVWAVAAVVYTVFMVQAMESTAESCSAAMGDACSSALDESCSDACSQSVTCSPDLGCSSSE